MIERLNRLGYRLALLRRGFPRKLTQSEFAGSLGVTPQAVSSWERGETLPEHDKLAKIAQFYGISVDKLLEDIDSPDALKSILWSPGTAAARSPDEKSPATEFPTYSGESSRNGDMVVHTDVMEYAKRPTILEGVPDGYGLLVVSDAMVPAYWAGDIALIHPRRPPTANSDVVLYDRNHRTGEARSIIRRLVSFDEHTWELQRYNPAGTSREARADWPICHQIVGIYKRRP